MKDCTHCKHAEWQRTKSGGLHPSGDGMCKFPYKLPPLPASMRWFMLNTPAISGGHINRRIPLSNHCAYYSRAD